MTAGAWVLVVAVVAALSFGLYRAAVDGRFRGTHRVRAAAAATSTASPTSEPAPATPSIADLAESQGLALELGERATLLQFSSAFCAPCRATRRTLTEVADVVPGVRHVEVDAEHHLELVRHLGVLRTPTTLVLDARGAEVTRAAGAPRKEQVLSALAGIGAQG
ncbi:thioredoxin family protein [Nocardioides sp. KIGAM211]|uniref:Thioredoxin family protein n=1 Tax=Nocardioides luti TaxID=2761101 RepID=A0A7X0RHP3_9ACTN|nr:thioredoxin family protein [Nocardioides luti]MBB6628477.1 thioredoxin family protein [Nocardioides luti]